MPRPSLKAERSEEILDAYGRCVAVHGVEGATLERIAEEAGLARALIRHNVGNKDALLEAFLDRFLQQSARDSEELFAALPDAGRLETMIDYLFDTSYTDPDQVNVTSALMIAATDRPVLAERLRGWLMQFVDDIQAEIAAKFPDGRDKDHRTVAMGIAAIYFNFESSVSIGLAGELRETSKQAALSLLGTLNRPNG